MYDRHCWNECRSAIYRSLMRFMQFGGPPFRERRYELALQLFFHRDASDSLIHYSFRSGYHSDE